VWVEPALSGLADLVTVVAIHDLVQPLFAKDERVLRWMRRPARSGHNGIVSSHADREREWVAQWRRAGVALERVRGNELAALSDADALAAADTLLALAATMKLPAHRVGWSGLVDLQQRLHATR
jgi:hypothetical protein